MTSTSSSSQKDWTGNKKTTFVTLGASNHTNYNRAQYDFYATEPKAVEELLKVETFDGSIWENCCGMGHISQVLVNAGYNVVSTDLVYRGYGHGGVDFYEQKTSLADNIVTNPPYATALEWTIHSLNLLKPGKKLALFLPIQFLESAKRAELFRTRPPARIWVAINRFCCGMNGEFYMKNADDSYVLDKNGNPKKLSSAKCYAWFVWDIGCYDKQPVIGWIN